MSKRSYDVHYNPYYQKYEYHLARAEHYKRKKMAYARDSMMYNKYAEKEYYHRMKAHYYKSMMKPDYTKPYSYESSMYNSSMYDS